MTPAGVYIHIPFCRSRCSYCDFATGMYETELAARYVDVVVSEIAAWREVDQPAQVDSIYFGGGTPSLLAPVQAEQILDAVRNRFTVLNDAEVTIELNPGDGATSENKSRKFQEFHRIGINRASFGAQTFDDRELKQLGRTHTSGDIYSTFHQLRKAGFENINFDLIAGLPGQSLARWKRNLDEALQLRPEHLSLYLLDVHEGTPLADQISRGMRSHPDDDVAAEMYRTMVDQVTRAGYQHYEISNFCLFGFEARHNTKYWTGAPYYGFGCSAHSFDGTRCRWSNERDASKYIDAMAKEQTAIVERTELSEDAARSESIFLALRLMRGLNLQNYSARFGRDLRAEYSAELNRLSDAGLIEIDEATLKLTSRGALLSNEVLATFV